MTLYVLRRLGQTIAMLWGLTIIVFALLQLAPGGPEEYLVPNNLTDPGQKQRIIHQLGLDQPMLTQYWHWLTEIVRGDFGTAYSYGQPVLKVIASRLAPTLELQVVVILLSIAVAIPIGVIAAVRRYSGVDHVVTTASLFGLSMPNFWFALLLILLFSVKLQWLPAYGNGSGLLLGSIPYFVLPTLVLGLALVPWYARFMRASMIETLQQDHIRTARAQGISERRIVFRQALKPSILPVLTIVGLSLPLLVCGSVIVESIFAWPGLGRLAYDSIVRQDFPLVMGLAVLTGGFVMLANLVVDLLYTVIDPRVVYG